jgi:hypothetical protein
MAAAVNAAGLCAVPELKCNVVRPHRRATVAHSLPRDAQGGYDGSHSWTAADGKTKSQRPPPVTHVAADRRVRCAGSRIRCAL